MFLVRACTSLKQINVVAALNAVNYFTHRMQRCEQSGLLPTGAEVQVLQQGVL